MTRRQLTWAAVLLALGALLRAWNLGGASLWSDEGFTWETALLPLGAPAWLWGEAPDARTILGRLYGFDAHPPLGYLAAKAWLSLWPALPPPGEAALRFPSWLAGVLALALAGDLARRRLPPRGALVSLGVASCLQAGVWCTQELRMYPFLSLWVCLAAWAADRGGRDGWRAGPPVWALASLLSLYTHYLGGIACAASALWLVGQVPRGHLRAWLLAASAVVVGFLPWLPVLARQVASGAGPPPMGGTGWLLWVQVAAATARDQVFGNALPSVPDGVQAAAAWLAVVVLASSLLLVGRQDLSLAWLLGLQILLPPLLLLGAWILLGRDVYQTRFFMFLSPLVGVALGAAWCRGGSFWAGVLLLVLGLNAWSLANWFGNPLYQRQPWRSAMVQVVPRLQPGDVVVVMNPFNGAVVRYYMQRLQAPATKVILPGLAEFRSGRLEQDLQGCTGVWLLLGDAWISDPQQEVPRWLSGRGRLVDGLVVENRAPAHNLVLLRYLMPQRHAAGDPAR